MLPQQSHRSSRSLWDRIWKDRHGDVVIFQMPNLWLIGWLVLTCVSLFSPSRGAANIFWWASSAVLAIWAILEIVSGVNYFRRLLGVLVLLMAASAAFGIGL